MDARTVLIVDADPRGAAVAELSLQRAGYLASVVNSADEAIVRLEEDVVDLVICDTALGGYGSSANDGFSLLAVIKAHPRIAVPVIMLSSSSAAADKVRGLELGAEDFLCKPLAAVDLLATVRVVFARRAQREIATAARSRLSGSTHDLSVVELMQTFEAATKSGTLKLRNASVEATLVFRHGALVDATLGKLTGRDAAFRAMLWGEVSYEIVFVPPDAIVPSAHPIGASTAAVILEGLRRADDWERLLRQLPPPRAYLTVREDELLDKLADIPDEVDGIIKLLDGSRTLFDVIDDSPFDDVSTLETLARLADSGLLVSGGEFDARPISLSTRVLPLDDDSSRRIIPLPGAASPAAPRPEPNPSASRAVPPMPTPLPGARVDATMASALAPAPPRKAPMWSSLPPGPEEVRRWKIRVAVFAVLALVAGFAVVALLRGCSLRARENSGTASPVR